MNTTTTIVSIISIVGFLILVLRNPEIRGMSTGKAFRLTAIWAAIIVGMVILIQWSGWHIQP
ncbi:hypothetical protein [Novosphingobium gossypii]|uniref:hypothetical protein n=1 Tax=Novosphingobium gossypii TaxID=1604774 RepID=UPI003D20A2CE